MKPELLLLPFGLAIAGCADKSVDIPNAEIEAVQLVFDSAEQTPAVMEKWSRSCVLCHVNGEGGAPKMGDVAAWGPRMAQGNAWLMSHTLEGFNRMPPLGYCMDCEEEDYAAMIKMMAGADE
ncbi:MAG: cytochrome c5 family protein [Gammaproteobacteria bacterium]|jgi:cytochrome c5|nr:cytochrome c5 family protein [Gammaproteobacteria bacterium]|tara:strand:- start:983 stop:1348 length:366 start_codon:yes stop_codon:yes gene_type:complete